MAICAKCINTLKLKTTNNSHAKVKQFDQRTQYQRRPNKRKERNEMDTK